MPKTRRILTRMSKGELSPLLEGSPDLAGYYEGASVMENVKILRQGGFTRWEGTRFIKEVKNSSKDTILWPFEFSVDDAYVLEVGDLYIRIYKSKAPVLDAGVHVEIATPFTVSDIREIHLTQSADVLFTFHGDYQQRKLSRISDTNWSMNVTTSSPPPSFEADTDFGDTLANSANTGNAVTFRAGSAIFLAADVGRLIIQGSGRAVITSLTDTQQVVADILDPFATTITAGPATLTSVGTAVTSVAHGLSVGHFVRLTSGAQSGEMRKVTALGGADTCTIQTAFSVDQGAGVTWNKIIPMSSGAWFLRLSPQTTLNPNISSPIGSQVTLVAGAAAFRTADVDKYIVVYGGVVKITNFDSTTQVRGTLESVMGDTDLADPDAAPAGAWTLESSSWSSARGWPKTGEFFQGRLVECSTRSQPTTTWMSRADDFDNFAIGVTSEDAVEFTMASRQVNSIEWVIEKNKALFLGTGGTEHTATGSGNTDALIGGDTLPQLDKVATNGCMAVQPVVSRQNALYVDRSRRKILQMGFDLNSDGQSDTELTVGAEHITESGVRLGPLAFQKRLDPRLYFTREDGQLVGMTYYPEQKVVGFTRRTTPGLFGCQAVIPTSGGGNDQVWTIVTRTINGATKRYVEMFEPSHEGLSARPWPSLQTDCAIIVTGITGTTVTGLSHLEAATVDVVKNGSALNQEVVTGGAITLTDALVPADVLEIGLHYDSTVTSMRPSIPGTVTEGLPMSWDSYFLRVHKSLGGKVNGEPIQYLPADLDDQGLYTGDVKVTGQDWSTDARVTILQDQPCPLTVLCQFGTLSMGESD